MYFVNNISEISQYGGYDVIEFNCEQCGLRVHKQKRTISDFLLCRNCKTEKTSLRKYGVKHAQQSVIVKQKFKQSIENRTEEEKQLIKEKIKKTTLERYGTENAFSSEKIKEKIKKTKLERYGDENYLNKEKQKETMIERYGGYTLQSNELKEKVMSTIESKFGSVRNMISQNIEKQNRTKLERYGDQSFNNIEKHTKTCLQKYGFESFSQTEEFTRKIRKKYEYNGTQFDSSWELALWIYAKDHNEQIEKNYVSFEYEVNGKKHLYYPDFLYEGQLIEIKGDHFFNGGKMICPFDESKNIIYEAKHQCGLQNHVQFWTSKEMILILDYVEEAYGKDYLKQFIRK